MPKSDKLELDRRIFTIQGWILEGVTYMLIIREILQKGWCTSERHAKRLVKKAHDEWKYEESEELEKKRQKRVHQLERLALSINAKYKGTPGAVNAQRGVFKLITEIEGTEAAKKIEVSGNGGMPIQQNITCEVVFKDYGPQPS